jgi:ATP-binding cassette subfamily B protein
MSAVERLEGEGGGTPPRPESASEAIETGIAELPAKSRARLRPLFALAPYVARYRGRAFLALIALTIAAITTLVVPIAVRRMIDFGLTPQGIAMINNYFSVMIAVVAVLAAASASRYYLVMTIGERIVADLRRDVFAHLISLSPAFFDSARSGELISRLTADTTQIKSAVGASVSIALRNVMLFIGAVAMMVVTSPRLSGFVLLAIPLIVIPLVAFGRWVRRLSRNAQDTLAEATAYASELVGAIRTVQAYTGERLANARFGGEVEQAYEAARVSTQARALLTAIIIFIVFSSVVAILWIGSHDVSIGAITPGRLGQFVLYTAFAAAGLGQLSEVWGEISAASGAAERLFEILRVKPEISAPASPRALPMPPRGDVAFEDVSFAYPMRKDIRAIERVSFSVRAGEKVAIVGPSGAGKSTLFHLLLRFYDPSSGTISFDGVPVRDADPQAVRSYIALVPQDSVVFAASARDNIRFGRPEASDAEVERAAELAHATEFIRRLPGGFDAPLGERGVTLSGGQRQRIAIARAILRDAPLLLLDEATSSLDAESETLVQTALEELMRHRTTIVIAHRLATVLSCDRILVLDQGRIVEQGTHSELVVANGLYAKLARLQFEGI